jgi:hypothetical protein
MEALDEVAIRWVALKVFCMQTRPVEILMRTSRGYPIYSPLDEHLESVPTVFAAVFGGTWPLSFSFWRICLVKRPDAESFLNKTSFLGLQSLTRRRKDSHTCVIISLGSLRFQDWK